MSKCGSSRATASGTMSAITRAPWLPPNTSKRNAPSGAGVSNGVAAAATTAGRTGLPVQVVLAFSFGS